MFEVSWCVGLYVTILALEFLPVVLERFGLHRLLALWQKWSGAYVAFAVTLFIFMMSRNVVYAAVTAVIFGTLAWLFRARDKGFEPIMLAIAAVTLSTMHQSSLGSLYLLMPNMLALAVVVARDAGLVLPVLDRRRNRARHPDRHVDREGLAPAARHDGARVGRADHVLVDARLPRFPARRHGAPRPARRRLRRHDGPGLRRGDRARRPRSARAPRQPVAPLPARHALLGSAPGGSRRRLQPDERRALRDDVPRPHALGRARSPMRRRSSSGASRSA